MKQKTFAPIGMLLTSVAVLAMGAAMTPAQAQDAARPPVHVKDAKLNTDVLNLPLTVVSVDKDKRQMVFKTDDDTVIQVGVRQSVKLERVKAGDHVDVSFVVSELVALTGADPGLRKSELTQAHMPDGTFKAVALTETYSVFAIDKAHQKVQLHDAHDQLSWLKVHNPDVFKDVKVGDKVRVVISLSEVASLKPAKAH